MSYINVSIAVMMNAIFKSVKEPLEFNGTYFEKMTVLWPDNVDLFEIIGCWLESLDYARILLYLGTPSPKGIVRYFKSYEYDAISAMRLFL